MLSSRGFAHETAIPIKDMSKKMMPNQHLLLVMKENTGRSTTEAKESATGRG